MDCRRPNLKLFRSRPFSDYPEQLADYKERGSPHRVNVHKTNTSKRVIERMRALKLQGLSYLRIAEHLNEQGLPTKRGGIWQPTTVRNILVRA